MNVNWPEVVRNELLKIHPRLFTEDSPTGRRFRADLREQAVEDIALAVSLEHDRQVGALEGDLDAVLKRLEAAEERAKEQFRRAERLLRAGMCPEDRAIDTAAGNDPDGIYPLTPLLNDIHAARTERLLRDQMHRLTITRIWGFDVYRELLPLQVALMERGLSFADMLEWLKLERPARCTCIPWAPRPSTWKFCPTCGAPS